MRALSQVIVSPFISPLGSRKPTGTIDIRDVVKADDFFLIFNDTHPLLSMQGTRHKAEPTHSIALASSSVQCA